MRPIYHYGHHDGHRHHFHHFHFHHHRHHFHRHRHRHRHHFHRHRHHDVFFIAALCSMSFSLLILCLSFTSIFGHFDLARGSFPFWDRP
jgi:hypothetical protein